MFIHVHDTSQLEMSSVEATGASPLSSALTAGLSPTAVHDEGDDPSVPVFHIHRSLPSICAQTARYARNAQIGEQCWASGEQFGHFLQLTSIECRNIQNLKS